MKTNAGSKYTPGTDVKEIAKMIRKDIADAIKAGRIPAGTKCSVRIDRFSGGKSIDLYVTALPAGFHIYSREYVEHTLTNKHGYFEGKRRSDEATALIKTLKSISDSYNYDDSDSMTDHFDVNFYGHEDFDSKLECDDLDAMIAELKAA